MIQKVESLVVAEAVVNLVQNSPEAAEVDCYIESYQNGREQGLMLWSSCAFKQRAQAIYIAQCRNSDQILICVGNYSMQSISEDAYSHKNLYKHNDYAGAAEFVLETAKRLFPIAK